MKTEIIKDKRIQEFKDLALGDCFRMYNDYKKDLFIKVEKIPDSIGNYTWQVIKIKDGVFWPIAEDCPVIKVNCKLVYEE